MSLPHAGSFHFSRHARNKLRSRRFRAFGLTEDVVIDIVTEPDIITSSKFDRSNAWKSLNGEWVSVTFIAEQRQTVIVTVTIKDRGPEVGGIHEDDI